jgi:hypothetical protein
MCKVQWSHHTEEEATWEREDELKEDFPKLFSKSSKSRDKILFKGVGFVTPKNSITKNHLATVNLAFRI